MKNPSPHDLLREAWQDAGGANATLPEVWNALLRIHNKRQARLLLANRHARSEPLTLRLNTLGAALHAAGLAIRPSEWVFRNGYAMNLSTGEVRPCDNATPFP